MPKVSSVIYNRLKKDMPLQMDGTLNYGKYSHIKVTPKRIKTDKSGFNTLTTGFFSTITFSSLMIGGSSFTSIHLGQNPVSISILQPDGARQICFARIEKGMNRIIIDNKIFMV